jgi:hypothetical protein
MDSTDMQLWLEEVQIMHPEYDDDWEVKSIGMSAEIAVTTKPNADFDIVGVDAPAKHTYVLLGKEGFTDVLIMVRTPDHLPHPGFEL